jgi:hypothetical protein
MRRNWNKEEEEKKKTIKKDLFKEPSFGGII